MLTPKDRLVQTTGVRSAIFEIMISVQFLLQHLEDTICALFDSIKLIELKSWWTTNQIEPKNGQLMVIHDCYQIMIEFTLSDHNQITNYDHISTKYFPYELESMIIRSTIRLIKSQLSIRLSNLRSNKVIIVESMRHSMLSTWSLSTSLFKQ